MHDIVRDFISDIKDRMPQYFSGTNVLEFGSANINGSAREYFEEAKDYTGIDARDDEGVDIVCEAHDYVTVREHPFDVFICVEMLEHDPYWTMSLIRGYECLKPGGLMIITCAAPPRKPHCVEESPEPGYYRNISYETMRKFIKSNFKMKAGDLRYVDGPEAGLLYWGIKEGADLEW